MKNLSNRHSSIKPVRRGAVLLVTLFFIMAMAMLGVSAIFLNGSAALLAKGYVRKGVLNHAAEAAIAVGKARLDSDATALPDSGYATFLSNAALRSVGGPSMAGVVASIYAGSTGSTTGQAGSFASIVADVRDAHGHRLVRRLELAKESFATLGFWSSSADNSRDAPISLPMPGALNNLARDAATAGFSLAPPTIGNETSVRTRIEFVAVDLNNDGDSTDVDEGFFKVYTVGAGRSSWLRADWPKPADATNVVNCGDWHRMGGVLKFFPAAIHGNAWFRDLLRLDASSGGGGLSQRAANAERAATLQTVMQHPGARCYLGGDPHLMALERTAALYPRAADRQKGGDDTTFTRLDSLGAWQAYTSTPHARIVAKRPYDAQYLFPMYRGFNPNAKGVVYADGTVGVSGVVRGRVTLYSPYTVVILDDVRYATDQAASTQSDCADILGMIGGANVVVADNAMNTPQDVGARRATSLDDTKDVHIHSMIMSLANSFGVEHYDTGPTGASDCEGTRTGRGCLYVTGGIIQDRRRDVGTGSGSGFVARYIDDRCAAIHPPPRFPTTDRYVDMHSYELERLGFDVNALFARLR